MKFYRVAVVFSLCLLMAACGGGNDGPWAPPVPPEVITTSFDEVNIGAFISSVRTGNSGSTALCVWTFEKGKILGLEDLSERPGTIGHVYTEYNYGKVAISKYLTMGANVYRFYDFYLTGDGGAQ